MNEIEERRLWWQVRQATVRLNKLDKEIGGADRSDPFEKALPALLATEALSRLPPAEAELLAALSWFGPANGADEPPPTEVREDLRDLIPTGTPAEGQKIGTIGEVVIAYGCGAWRHVEPGGEGWEHRWQAAWDWLDHRTQGWVLATVKWLYAIQLQGYSTLRPLSARLEETQSEGAVLAKLLWSGQCDCWRLRQVEEDAALDSQARKRAERCLLEHRLSSWKPEKMALSDFIARAIKGPKAKEEHDRQKGFVPGGVVQGMFFPTLYREHGVRFGKVLGWRCARHPEQFCQAAYCFHCKEEKVLTPFNETRYMRMVERLFVVKEPQGRYDQEQFWRCQKCGSYYRAKLAACPLPCGASRTRGAAQSAVWVRGVPVKEENVEPLVIPPVDGEISPEKRYEIQEALALFDPSERQAVKMIVKEERSQSDTAKELGLSVAHVKMIMEKLKKILPGESAWRTL